VLDCQEHVQPWRMCRARGAHQTIEFASGALRHLSPKLGDAWTWESA
jgi:hypothetical protein